MNRRQQLIHCAEELFGRYSYERTTMDDIAKAASVSKGSLYLEFHSKEDLYIAVVHTMMTQRLEDLAYQLENCHSGHVACLKHTLVAGALQVYDTVASQHHSLESLIRTSHRIRQSSLFYFEGQLTIIASFLERCAAEGSVAPQANYTQVAYYLTTAMSGLYPPYEPKNTIRPDDHITRDDLEAATHFIVNTFMAGLQQRQH